WTAEITGLLETLPAQGASGRPNIDFRTLNMSSVVPARSDPNRYEGQPVVAEMNVSGTVVSTDVLAEFIRALEGSSAYGVSFQSAQRQDETDLYEYSLTVGALAEDQ